MVLWSALAISEQLERAVILGAELLDSVKPGWWRKIDPETFLINSFERCILGQLFGNAYVGWRLLSAWTKPGSSAEDYGFADWATEPYWRAAIRLRLLRETTP